MRNQFTQYHIIRVTDLIESILSYQRSCALFLQEQITLVKMKSFTHRWMNFIRIYLISSPTSQQAEHKEICFMQLCSFWQEIRNGCLNIEHIPYCSDIESILWTILQKICNITTSFFYVRRDLKIADWGVCINEQYASYPTCLHGEDFNQIHQKNI